MIFLWFMTKFNTFAQTHPSHLWSILLKSIYFNTNKYCMKCIMMNDRSSRPEVFCKKGGLTNSAKFIGRHLCQSLFLIKLQASGFIKKKRLAQVFSCEFCKISKNTFSYKTPAVAASKMIIVYDSEYYAACPVTASQRCLSWNVGFVIVYE